MASKANTTESTEVAAALGGIAGSVVGEVNPTMAKFAVGVASATQSVMKFAGGATAGGLAGAGVALGAFIGIIGDAYQAIKGLAAAASPNGLRTLDLAWHQLSSTLGGIALPAFSMLAAAVSTVSDKLSGNLAGSASEVKDGYVALKPAALELAANLYVAAKAALDFGTFVVKNGSSIASLGELALPLFGVTGNLAEAALNIGKVNAFGIDRFVDSKLGRSELLDQQDADNFAKNLESILGNMRQAMGPKAEFSSSAGDVYKKAILAGTMSPFEAKQLSKWDQNLRLLGDIVKAIKGSP